jgi:hypothetical protein
MAAAQAPPEFDIAKWATFTAPPACAACQQKMQLQKPRQGPCVAVCTAAECPAKDQPLLPTAHAVHAGIAKLTAPAGQSIESGACLGIRACRSPRPWRQWEKLALSRSSRGARGAQVRATRWRCCCAGRAEPGPWAVRARRRTRSRWGVWPSSTMSLDRRSQRATTIATAAQLRFNSTLRTKRCSRK